MMYRGYEAKLDARCIQLFSLLVQRSLLKIQNVLSSVYSDGRFTHGKPNYVGKLPSSQQH
jgi:hypothetical protein